MQVVRETIDDKAEKIKKRKRDLDGLIDVPSGPTQSEKKAAEDKKKQYESLPDGQIVPKKGKGKKSFWDWL